MKKSWKLRKMLLKKTIRQNGVDRRCSGVKEGMDGTDMEKALMELRDFERNAKRLYEANPKAFDHVVWNWEEFAEGYLKTQPQDVKLEENAPFFMGSLLTEQDCFPDENMEVSVLLHDRYVPPFYHSLKFIKIVYALRGGFFFYLLPNSAKISTWKKKLVS